MESLERIMDYEAKVPEDWLKNGALLAKEVERLKRDFFSNMCITTIPRRLGAFVHPTMLAADKQLGRRMGNVALRALQWRGADEEWMHDNKTAYGKVRQDDEAYREAAQRLWAPWYYDRLVWIEQHVPVVACWGVRHSKRKDANEMCAYLRQEYDLMVGVWNRTAPREWREPDDRPEMSNGTGHSTGWTNENEDVG